MSRVPKENGGLLFGFLVLDKLQRSAFFVFPKHVLKWNVPEQIYCYKNLIKGLIVIKYEK